MTILLDKILVDGENLTYKQFEDIVIGKVKLSLSQEAIIKVKHSRQFVVNKMKENKIVYGINTGFGKFSDQVISSKDTDQLQLNLIKSHACGVGEPLSEAVVRGMMLLRINALAKGYSGINLSTIELLIELLNHQIHPVIPCQGSLGASGDLAPLAHMCLPLLGLGKVKYKDSIISSIEALQDNNLTPIKLESKEGLALINGTQMMCSISALCIITARNLILAADIISAMTLEALSGITDAFHPLLHKVRGQEGQITTAENILLLTKNSMRINDPGGNRVQDAYSLRCIPQVHGATKDAYKYAERITAIEMNAATDNPLVFSEIDNIISGGNFHGQPLALASDFLTIAMAEIANISERRTERLVNPQLSKLPAFLTNNGGLNSGYMILQYVAAALVSENKVLAHPASVDSIPSSANQEDHVSMGAVAARKCWQVLQNVTKVLAIEYVCAAQALEFKTGTCGQGTQIAYQLIRNALPKLEEDREGHQDIEAATKILESGQLVKDVKSVIGIKM